jgi:DNA-binding CsgD family transcriptional regulator
MKDKLRAAFNKLINKMPGNPRNQTVRLSDRHKILKLRLTGATQAEIAKELGVSQPTISLELKRIDSDLEISRSPVEAWKAEMILLNQLADELIASWDESKEPTVEVTTSGGETFTHSASQPGNVQFLAQLMKILERKSKLNGVDNLLSFSTLESLSIRAQQLGFILVAKEEAKNFSPMSDAALNEAFSISLPETTPS